MRFCIGPSIDFGSNMDAKWSQKGSQRVTKIHPKIGLAAKVEKGSGKGGYRPLFLEPFLVNFWINLALKNDEKTLVFTVFSRFWPSKNPSKNRCEKRVRKKRDTAKKKHFFDTAAVPKKPTFRASSFGGYLRRTPAEELLREVGCVIGGAHESPSPARLGSLRPGADLRLPTATYPPRA